MSNYFEGIGKNAIDFSYRQSGRPKNDNKIERNDDTTSDAHLLLLQPKQGGFLLTCYSPPKNKYIFKSGITCQL